MLNENDVANMLRINLVIEEKDDSLMISKASWKNVPFPPNFARPEVPKPHELDLTRHSLSMKGYVRSVTDSIIYSKDLK